MATTILVADENANVLRSVKVILEQEGYEVVGASDMTGVQSALEGLLADRAPGLFLIDAELPPTDGYAACRSLKDGEASAHVPVLLMVGTFVPLDRDALESCRAEGFITKPFDPLALKARVKEVARAAPEETREDTRRMKFMEVPRSEASPEVMAQIDALAEVPEIDAEDLSSLADQDSLLPADDEDAHTPTDPSTATTQSTSETVPPSEEAPEEAELSQNVVAFVPRAEGGFPSEEADQENLTEAERRIIEDNARVLRQVSDEEGKVAAQEAREEEARRKGESTPTDLSALVTEPDIPPAALAVAPVEPTGPAGEASEAASGPTPADSGEEELFDLDDSQSLLRIDASDEEGDPEGTGPVFVTPPPVPAEAPASRSMPTGRMPVFEGVTLDETTLDRIVTEVVRRISDGVVREIAWEVVPELAHLYVQKKLQEESRKKGQ